MAGLTPSCGYLAKAFGELSGTDYGVRRCKGQKLQLPQPQAWWSGRENLAAQ